MSSGPGDIIFYAAAALTVCAAVLVAQPLQNCRNVHARFNAPGRKRVAEIVKPDLTPGSSKNQSASGSPMKEYRYPNFSELSCR